VRLSVQDRGSQGAKLPQAELQWRAKADDNGHGYDGVGMHDLRLPINCEYEMMLSNSHIKLVF
jgi:hypothetical protein